jgi:hypothetical protein
VEKLLPLAVYLFFVWRFDGETRDLEVDNAGAASFFLNNEISVCVKNVCWPRIICRISAINDH